MNWKSIISVIALLAVGFVAGFFTNRYLTIQTAKKIAVLRQAKGMENRLYDILELDAAQKEKLSPVISKHFENLAQLNKERREKRVAMMNELKAAILPVLKENQKERFEKFSRKLKRMPRNRKKFRKNQ